MSQLPSLAPQAFADLIEILPVPAVICSADGTILCASKALREELGDRVGGGAWSGASLDELPLTALGAPLGVSADAPAGGTGVFALNGSAGLGQRYQRSSMTVAGDGQGAVALHFLTPLAAGIPDTLHPLAALGGRPAHLDPESGLQDRSAISHVLHSEVARCRRYGNPLSIVLLSLRDAHGAAFDNPESLSPPAVLGQMLAECTRWADSVGRWSPEHFLLVLPETALTAARHLVTKIENNVQSLARHDMMLDVVVAASQWHKGDDARSLLARAESRLQASASDTV